MALKRILVGSPVYQKPEILKAFLNSLKNLNRVHITIDYIFVDDNKDEQSKEQLGAFQREGSSVLILPGRENSTYHCSEDTHYWSDNLMLRVAEYKNQIIRYALEQNYDALFFVDSDLILHPNLIEHLNQSGKDIISEIFWTVWHPGDPREPNVWLFDEYDMAYRTPGEQVDEDMIQKRGGQFLNQLKVPGVYEVGGLGACTLISRAALLKGVDFSYIPNLTIHGEDRFFCIRAAVLGIGLYADTFYPAYHIYRPSDLKGAPDAAKDKQKEVLPGRRSKDQRNRITLSMVVRNEEGRYLSKVLGELRNHIDEAVIIDDASDDGTVKICEELLKGIPHRLISNSKQMFTNEVELRKKQWEETIRTYPDWILNLDADEVPEAGFWDHLREMIDNARYDRYSFHLYDMWNETEYRDDPLWNAHEGKWDFLVRYQPDFPYKWKETPQHCGRFPENIKELPGYDSEFRVRHYGWASLTDRKCKYKRYQLMDPDAVYGIREQYDSILDEQPHLVPWREEGYHKKQKD